MNDKFYKISEVAKMLNVSPRTVTSMIRNKKLLAVNIGTGKRSHWRVFDGQLQKFIAESYPEGNCEDQ